MLVESVRQGAEQERTTCAAAATAVSATTTVATVVVAALVAKVDEVNLLRHLNAGTSRYVQARSEAHTFRYVQARSETHIQVHPGKIRERDGGVVSSASSHERWYVREVRCCDDREHRGT